jgi:uncharacterized DUF497 family protein
MLFDWDEANRRHISEHLVSPEEAEQAVASNPWDVEVQVTEGEERFVQVGATGRGRVLVVVFNCSRATGSRRHGLRCAAPTAPGV